MITNRFFPIPAEVRGRPIVDEFSNETLVCVIAVAPWFVVEFFAIATSIVFKIKVWVGIEADSARELDVWLPVNLDDESVVGSNNFVIIHIYSLSIMIIVFLFLLLFVGFISLAEVARIRRVHPFFTVGGMIFGVVLFALSACKFVETILLLVPSKSPRCCWGSEKSVDQVDFHPDALDRHEEISQDDYLYF